MWNAVSSTLHCWNPSMAAPSMHGPTPRPSPGIEVGGLNYRAFIVSPDCPTMSTTPPACPQCGLENTYADGDQFICPAGDGVIRDANGQPLADGDAVLLIKDLKVKGSSTVLKKGTKVKSIRLVHDNGDHDVDCKTDQGQFMLKSVFLKKA